MWSPECRSSPQICPSLLERQQLPRSWVRPAKKKMFLKFKSLNTLSLSILNICCHHCRLLCGLQVSLVASLTSQRCPPVTWCCWELRGEPCLASAARPCCPTLASSTTAMLCSHYHPSVNTLTNAYYSVFVHLTQHEELIPVCVSLSLFYSCLQDLRRKAARLVAAKCTLASRVDSFHESSDGKVTV